MTRTGIRQYDYTLTLIDDVDGSLIITPSALDKAMNSLDENRIIDNSVAQVVGELEEKFQELPFDQTLFLPFLWLMAQGVSD